MPQSVQNIIESAHAAITYSDASLAYKLLAEIRVLNMPELQKTSLLTYQEISAIFPKLRAVALPLLSDDDAADVLRNHILLSFDIEVPMENFLSAKLFSVSYFSRHALRKKLQQAFLENREMTGVFTLGQWAAAFDKKFDQRTRTQGSLLEFLRESREAQSLDPMLRERLKKALYIYDYLLVSTIPATKPQLNAIVSYAQKNIKNREPSSMVYYSTPSTKFIHPTASRSYDQARSIDTHSTDNRQQTSSAPVSLSIEDAMEKYPRVGEQLVTSAPIVLKPFPQPVRPSIKNWIADYHHALGVGEHGIMERGSYLYNNPNTRTLTESERQKVALILKSVDDNTPLAIDAEKQEVSFERQTTDTQRPMSAPQPMSSDAQRSADDSMHFSSPHTLPVERATPSQPQQPSPNAQKNVVNLREN